MSETLEQQRLDVKRRLLAARLAAARQNAGSAAEDVIYRSPDGGRVVKAPDGSLSFASPGYSTSDPAAIAEIMQGADASARVKAGFDEQTIAGAPIAARALKAIEGVPFIGQWADEAVGMVSPQAGQNMRASSAAMDRQRPGQSLALGLAGGLVGSAPLAVAAAPLAAGARALSPIAKATTGLVAGATAGAIEGAASGAGRASEDRMGGAMGGALFGGVAGGVMGAAAPAIGAGAKEAYKYLFKKSDISQIAASLGVSKPAAQVIKTYMGQDNPAEAARLLARAGKGAMLADAGPATGVALDKAVSMGGAAMGIAKEAVEGRAAAAMGMLNDVMDDVLGAPEGTRAIAGGIAARTSAARKAAYDAAYATAIDYAAPSGRAVEDVLARIPRSTLGAAIQEANDAMMSKGVKNAQIMAQIAPDGSVTFMEMPNVQQLDEIKKALDTLADAARDQFGRLTGPGQRYAGLAADLREAVKLAAPRYATAIKLGGDKIAEDKALALGQKLLSPTMTREDVRLAIKDASDEALLAAKKGLRSAIDEGLAQVQAVMSDPNVEAREAISLVKKLSSRANRDKVADVLGAKAAEDLMDTLDTAGTQLALRTAIAANSKTAVRAAGDDVMKSISRAGPVEAIKRGEGFNAAKEIIQKMTARTPADILAREQGYYAEVARALTQIRGPSAQVALQYVQKAMAGQPVTEAQARLVANVLTTALGASGYQALKLSLTPETPATGQR